MEHEFENAVWESCLKTAVIKNSLFETENIMADPEYSNTNVPKRYDLKMNKIIRHNRRYIKQRSILKYGYRTAIILIVFAGISSVFFMQFEEVRSACNHVLMNIFEKYIEFDFNPGERNNTNKIVFGYLPQGFQLSRSELDDGMDILVYENSKGYVIALACFKSESSIQMDNERYQIRDILINGEKGKFFESQDKNMRDYILWNSNDSFFMLSSNLKLEEMKKVAENIYFQ